MNILKVASNASQSLSRARNRKPQEETNPTASDKHCGTDPTRTKVAKEVSSSDPARSRPPRETKASKVEALLARREGASLEALCEATGWKPHTCRAFLTGLRRKGRAVSRDTDTDGKSIYRIVPAAPTDGNVG